METDFTVIVEDAEMTDKNTNKDHFEVMYEQYWQHTRHQEIQRLSFTTIYSVLVAAVLAFLTSQVMPDPISTLLLYIFLVVLSVLGYFIIYSAGLPAVIFSRLTEQIAVCKWNVSHEYLRWFSKMESRKKKRIKVGTVFILFYSLMASVFFAMLTKQIISFFLAFSLITMFLMICSCSISFTIFTLLYFFLLEKDMKRIVVEISDKVNRYREKNPK